MSYTKFLDEEVFANPEHSVTCNSIYDALLELDSLGNIQTKFAISGTLSKIIQGDPLEDLKVISFVTDDAELLDFAKTKMAYILNAQVLNFGTQVQYFLDGLYIEIIFLDSLGTINTVTNLQVQAVADIPAYIN